MMIFGTGSHGGWAAAAGGGSAASSATQAKTTSGASQPSGDRSGDALQDLINYLSESPAKRMEDAWLAHHHLTEKALAAMPPDQQKAIRKEMADDIKKQLEQKLGGKTGANANIVA